LTCHFSNCYSAAVKYAYSYQRWSTKLQGKELRDSKSRQSGSATEWLKDHPEYAPGEVFVDPGKSSFGEGKHIGVDGYGRAKGELERFLQLVESGEVAPGSLLLIDSYDRFSRLKPSKALDLFMRVIHAGIGLVFTGSYRKEIIDEDAINNDSNTLQFIIGEMIRAYNESAEKSRKIKSAKRRKLEQLKSGLIVPHNNVPKYLVFDAKANTYEHNEHTPHVAQIARDFLKGNSLFSIAKDFNQRGIKTFRRGFSWSATSCRCILRNRILIGEFLGNKKFCKPIISQEEFDTIQMRLSNNRWLVRGRSSTHMPNIFRGLAFCSECGATMEVCHSNGRHDKAVYRYYRCPSTSHSGVNCGNRHYVKASEVEAEFMVEFLMKTPEGLFRDNNGEAKAIQHNIATKEMDKAVIEKKLVRLATVEDMGIEVFKKQTAALNAQLNTLQQEIDGLTNDLRQVRGAPTDFTDLKKVVKGFGWKDVSRYNEATICVYNALQDVETRKKLQVLLPSMFGKLVIYTEAGGTDNGAFKVLDRAGKVIYESLDFGIEKRFERERATNYGQK
jgi:hypothetical protein